MEQTKSNKYVRMCVVGDSKIGKTCLLNVFNDEKLPIIKPIPDIILTFNKYVIFDDAVVALECHDVTGKVIYDYIRSFFYKEVTFVLLCFSLDDPTSLTNVVKKWKPEIDHHIKDKSVFLIGLKSDLKNSKTCKMKDLMPIPRYHINNIKHMIDAVDYLECSAMEVKSVFLMFARVARWLKNNFDVKKVKKKRFHVVKTSDVVEKLDKLYI